MKKLIAMAMALIMVLGCGSAMAENTKHERVYVVTDAGGTVRSITDSIRLENADGLNELTDRTMMTEIVNAGGKESFTLDGETLTWQADGKDIIYQGTSDRQPAVIPTVRLTLDGGEVSAEELKTKTGEAELTVSYVSSGELPALAVTVLPLPEDLTLSPDTDRAVHARREDLGRIAAERIRTELVKLLCAPAAGRILRDYPDVMAAIIPDLAPMLGYDQRNHHHHYDLWEHTVQGVENVPPEEDLRLAMLLHDTGKPGVCTLDENGEAHYAGHQALSSRIAARVTEALRCSAAQRERVVNLVLHHDIPLRTADGSPATDRRFLLRKLNRFGERDLRALFQIHRADRIATGYSTRQREDQRMKERMEALDALLADATLFATDLTKTPLAEKIRADFAAMLAGPGAVRKALQSL